MIIKARTAAEEAHKGQIKKSSGAPFITHPLAVAGILTRHRFGPELIAAGLLHDTVEKTELTHEDIFQIFGEKVAVIVHGCTDHSDTGTWIERKVQHVSFIKTASRDVKVVACADKLHNLQIIAEQVEQFGDNVWERFVEGRDSREWYYRTLVECFSSGPNSLKTLALFKEFLFTFQSLFG
ncbi:MAG: HD domain-containing protein [Candidatus Aminicenantes bacterium]|nr:HD domain-containing protein [Candidatus Aminicenantes bacterium]